MSDRSEISTTYLQLVQEWMPILAVVDKIGAAPAPRFDILVQLLQGTLVCSGSLRRPSCVSRLYCKIPCSPCMHRANTLKAYDMPHA
jgi:hypothetical protein